MYAESTEVRQLFSEYGQRLADFLAPILMRFRARTLVLGGNISRSWQTFSEEFKSGLRKHGCLTRICVSEPRDKAAIAGAASLFADKKDITWIR